MRHRGRRRIGIDQSGVPFDRVVMEDLAADYAKQLGKQVVNGLGTGGQLKGYLTATSANSQTWTQASRRRRCSTASSASCRPPST